MEKAECVVVMLDDPRFGSGPGTVVEVTSDSLKAIRVAFKDRDGARSAHLRIWSAYENAAKGDRVSGETVKGGLP